MPPDLDFVFQLIDTNKKLIEKIYQLQEVIQVYERQTSEKTLEQKEASELKERLLKEVEAML